MANKKLLNEYVKYMPQMEDNQPLRNGLTYL